MITGRADGEVLALVVEQPCLGASDEAIVLRDAPARHVERDVAGAVPVLADVRVRVVASPQHHGLAGGGGIRRWAIRVGGAWIRGGIPPVALAVVRGHGRRACDAGRARGEINGPLGLSPRRFLLEVEGSATGHQRDDPKHPDNLGITVFHLKLTLQARGCHGQLSTGGVGYARAAYLIMSPEPPAEDLALTLLRPCLDAAETLERCVLQALRGREGGR